MSYADVRSSQTAWPITYWQLQHSSATCSNRIRRSGDNSMHSKLKYAKVTTCIYILLVCTCVKSTLPGLSVSLNSASLKLQNRTANKQYRS
jgi:hypothetical protein